MPSFWGNTLVVNFIWASGTLNMGADYTTFTYTPSVVQLDDTAGTDTALHYIPGHKGGALAFAGKMQSGSISAWGSALVEGSVGTVIFYPEGTADGKYRGTIPAFVNSMVMDNAYNTNVNVNVSWTQNGLRTEGTVA